MQVVLLSNDLMVVSHVTSAAAVRSAEVRVANNSEAAIALHVERPANLVVIDLGLPALVLVELVNTLKSTGEHAVQIVAFGPHVHADRLTAARNAGCDSVLSRGQFFAQVESILSGPAD